MKKFISFFRSRKISGSVLVFLILIYIPLLNNIFEFYKGKELMEKKGEIKATVFRIGDIPGYFQQFNKYYKNNFPFRSSLLYMNNFLRVKIFGVSPVDRVMIGRDGWLYIKKLNENGREIDYSRSIDKFSSEELALWFKIFSERGEWLGKMGIKMFIVIVPNKSSIYPEFLPEYIRGVTSQVRTNQLIKYFRKNSSVDIIDLRGVFKKNKDTGLLYHKTDSHWNFYGAWLGYSEIIGYLSRMYKGTGAKPFTSFHEKKRRRYSGGDLAVMLALDRTLYKEDFFRLFHDKRIKIEKKKLEDFNFPKVNSAVTLCCEGTLPKTIMIHDSFGLRLRKFLSPHFSEIIYLRDWGFNIFPELIKRERPKIVFYQIAERFLHNFSLSNPTEVSVEKEGL